MNKLTLITLLFCAFTIKAQQNLVLNGSFVLNNITQCWIGFNNSIDYNNTLFYSNYFG